MSAPKPAPGFFNALTYPMRGARFVYVEQRHLAKYWVPPIILSALALVAVVWWALAAHDRVAAALWTAPAGDAWFDQLKHVLSQVLSILVALALIAAGALVVALSTSVIAAPFNDALSEAVESICSGVPPRPTSLRRVATDLRRTVGLELGKWSVFIVVMGPLLVISWLVPGPGTALYLVFGSVITVLFFAIDYLDFSAARHDFTLRQRVALLRRHPSSVVGLGLGIWGLLWVPLLNLFLMPAAVAGATMLFLELHAPKPRG
jgi:CysZ protein